MKHFKQSLKLALATAIFGIAPLCAAGEPTTRDIQSQLLTLQEQVQQLQDNQKAQPATAPTTGATPTPTAFSFENDKWVLRDAAGSFSASPIVLWQFRTVSNLRQDGPGPKGQKVDAGFENRRLRVGMQGNLLNPDLTYKLLISADNGGSAVPLELCAQYRFNPDLALKFGQFKDPWTQEENTGDDKQMAVEKSLLNAFLGSTNTDRVQGVGMLFGQGKPFRGQVVVHDGALSKNTNFQDGPASATPMMGNVNEAWGATGRMEYFVKGTPKQYDDFSAMGNTEDLLVLGTGAEFTQGGSSNMLLSTFDAQYENTSGLGLFGEFMSVARDVKTPTGGATGVNRGTFFDYGCMVQLSYVLNQHWEVFGRYDYTRLDASAFNTARAIKDNDLHEITVGVNYFIWKHHAKVTVDASYLPNGVPVDVTGLGYLSTNANEFVLRGQFTFAL